MGKCLDPLLHKDNSNPKGARGPVAENRLEKMCRNILTNPREGREKHGSRRKPPVSLTTQNARSGDRQHWEQTGDEEGAASGVACSAHSPYFTRPRKRDGAPRDRCGERESPADQCTQAPRRLFPGGSLMVACDQHPLNRETPSHPSWPAGTEARQSHRLKVKVWRAGLPSPPSSGRQEVDTRTRGRHCPAASRVRGPWPTSQGGLGQGSVTHPPWLTPASPVPRGL